MPTMNTDVTLSDASHTIIIECKWTPTTLQITHGAQRLRSEHLYQLNAYLHHHPRRATNSIKGCCSIRRRTYLLMSP